MFSVNPLETLVVWIMSVDYLSNNQFVDINISRYGVFHPVNHWTFYSSPSIIDIEKGWFIILIYPYQWSIWGDGGLYNNIIILSNSIRFIRSYSVFNYFYTVAMNLNESLYKRRTLKFSILGRSRSFVMLTLEMSNLFICDLRQTKINETEKYYYQLMKLSILFC